jgi:hypothetical protein
MMGFLEILIVVTVTIILIINVGFLFYNIKLKKEYDKIKNTSYVKIKEIIPEVLTIRDVFVFDKDMIPNRLSFLEKEEEEARLKEVLLQQSMHRIIKNIVKEKLFKARYKNPIFEKKQFIEIEIKIVKPFD